MIHKEKTLLLQSQIAVRARDMGLLHGDIVDLLCDLDAVDIAFRMDWDGLLKADAFNFAHDVLGIQHSIDRSKCCLYSNPPKIVFKDEFVPRYARS